MTERDDSYWEGMSRSIERGEYEVAGPVEYGPAPGATAPWPIVVVESRGSTVVRVTHRDGTVADHRFDYLLGRGGVFAHLTAEMIPTAQLVEGTVAWTLPCGQVIDLAPDALWEHAVTGCCPAGTCQGWTPAHTMVTRRPER